MFKPAQSIGEEMLMRQRRSTTKEDFVGILRKLRTIWMMTSAALVDPMMQSMNPLIDNDATNLARATGKNQERMNAHEVNRLTGPDYAQS
jgi:6-phosphogluconate dehydrogenase (decarboxylating)